MSKRSGSAIIAAAALAIGASATSAQSRPAYNNLRWAEDWSVLKDAPEKTDFFDPIKHVPLGAEGVYASFGGQLRERYEVFNNNAFGAGPQDDDGYLLHRILLHGDLHAGPFRLFVEGKSAMIDGRTGGPRPTDADEIDLQQLFADGTIPFDAGRALRLRFGRQEMSYGAQRLISPLDWVNTRRTFEGFHASLTWQTHTLDAFLVRPVVIEKEQFNQGDGDTTFGGVYDTIRLPGVIEGAGTQLEAYVLGLWKQPGVTGATVDSDTYTVGGRLSAKPKPWDFDVEADYQFGQFGSADISAWSVAAEGGYTFDVALSPRVYAGVDYASGDDDPTDGDYGTFNQLFPLGHAYFGYIDVVGRQNIFDVHPGVQVVLLKDRKYVQRLTLRGDYHLFWRASDDDALYNAAGGVQRADGGSDESFVGAELDLLINWQIDRHTSALFGYSHFFAGDFIEQTGPDGDIAFFYAAAQFTF